MHDAVVGCFLSVLIDETTREHGCHLGTVQGGHFSKDTWVGLVTAILGEKERKRGVSEIAD